MAANPKHSLTVHFSPQAGGGTAAQPAMGVEIVTELKGVLTRTTASCKLCARLLVEFGRAAVALCSRARLAGITPTDHAPLRVRECSYAGSTCCYGGPRDEPWLIYSDYPYSQDDRGPVLQIDFARANLFRNFRWPSPVIEFDPPLQPGEASPFADPHPVADMLAAHNATRGALGLATLGYNATLAQCVEDHLDWLLQAFPTYCDGTEAAPDTWNPHLGDGADLTPADRAWGDGYPPTSAIGENLGLRHRSTDEQFLGWINSPVHYANLTNARWRAVGFARRQIPTLPPGRYLWGALFGEVYLSEDSELVEQSPLELVSLLSLFPASLPGETETGVQLPMRLFAVQGQTAVQLAELTYEAAPGFTGSGTQVQCKRSPIWTLPAADLLAALSAPAVLECELRWRVYKGGGDMNYHALCDGDEIPLPYRDRRNPGIGGGSGLVETDSYLAARVAIEQMPWPFLIQAAPASAWSACVGAMAYYEAGQIYPDYWYPPAAAIEAFAPGARNGAVQVWRYSQGDGWISLYPDYFNQGMSAIAAGEDADLVVAGDVLVRTHPPLLDQMDALGQNMAGLQVVSAADGAQISYRADGSSRAAPRHYAVGPHYWTAQDGTVVSWGGPFVFVGGREAATLPCQVLAACLVEVGGEVMLQIYTGGHPHPVFSDVLQPAFNGCVYRKAVGCGAAPWKLCQRPIPRVYLAASGSYFSPEPDAFEWSSDGKSLLCFVRHHVQRVVDVGLGRSVVSITPGAAYRADFEASGELGAWVELLKVSPPAPTAVPAPHPLTLLLAAVFDGGGSVAVRTLQIEATETPAIDYTPTTLTLLENGSVSRSWENLRLFGVTPDPQPTAVAKAWVSFPRSRDGAQHAVLTQCIPGRGDVDFRTLEISIGNQVVAQTEGVYPYGARLSTLTDAGWLPAGCDHDTWAIAARALFSDGRARHVGFTDFDWVVPQFRYQTVAHAGTTLIHIEQIGLEKVYQFGSGATSEVAVQGRVSALRVLSPRVCKSTQGPPQVVAQAHPVYRHVWELLQQVNTMRQALQPLVLDFDLCAYAAMWSASAGQTNHLGAYFPREIAVEGAVYLDADGLLLRDLVTALSEAGLFEGLFGRRQVYFGAYRTVRADGVLWSVMVGGQRDN